jgi:hypothetical protein
MSRVQAGLTRNLVCPPERPRARVSRPWRHSEHGAPSSRPSPRSPEPRGGRSANRRSRACPASAHVPTSGEQIPCALPVCGAVGREVAPEGAVFGVAEDLPGSLLMLPVAGAHRFEADAQALLQVGDLAPGVGIGSWVRRPLMAGRRGRARPCSGKGRHTSGRSTPARWAAAEPGCGKRTSRKGIRQATPGAPS